MTREQQRFHDSGYDHYFAVCKDSATVDTTVPYRCGKSPCTQTDAITTPRQTP